MVVVFGVVKSDGRDWEDFGAEETEERDFLGRLRVRHIDFKVVAARTADVSEADAGVAGGAFDDGATGGEEPTLFSVFNYVESGTVWGESVKLKLGK